MGRLAVLNLKCTMQSWTRTGERECTTAAGRKNLKPSKTVLSSTVHTSDDDKNDVGARRIRFVVYFTLYYCLLLYTTSRVLSVLMYTRLVAGHQAQADHRAHDASGSRGHELQPSMRWASRRQDSSHP